MNPNQGEVSRAMRNRCLEINVPAKEVAPVTNDDVTSNELVHLDEWKIICESKALNRDERDMCYEAYGESLISKHEYFTHFTSSGFTLS